MLSKISSLLVHINRREAIKNFIFLLLSQIIISFILNQIIIGKEIKDKSIMSSFRAVFVTVPTIDVGKKLASGLVKSKLAACVNIIPQITSVYEWEGEIKEDPELMLMIKTQSHLVPQLSKFVQENHPYDLPEVIALPIEQGSQAYLDWIAQNTKREEKIDQPD